MIFPLPGSHPCLVVLLLAGTQVTCTPQNGGPIQFESRDSAGIRISVSHSHLWGEGPGWKISEAQVLEIGPQEGEDAYLLHAVMGATVTPEGWVVVANAGDCSVRAFDEVGESLWTAGGS